MLRDKQKKLPHFLLSLFTITLSMVHIPLHAHLTSFNKIDPIPMFTTLNLDDQLLLTKEQLFYKDYDWAEKKHNHFVFSLSPFAQNADRGKTIKGERCSLPFPLKDDCGNTITDTPLGDLTGRTAMIPLLYNTNGKWPNNIEDPEKAFGAGSALLAAYKALFPEGANLNSENFIDPDQRFAYFSFPMKYRKRGVAFQAAARFFNFGLYIQTRVSTIRQVSQDIINLTNLTPPAAEVPAGISAADVDRLLMDEVQTIAQQSNIDMCNDFIRTSLEEIRFNLFWRQAFAVNQDADSDWAKFLVIPYVLAGASASPSKMEDQFNFFAAPFGNNGHSSVGFTTGLNLDFLETIEIGGEIGYTHFFNRRYCRPVPNNEFQMNLYPFSTQVDVSPGDNWYFCARLAAYHFVDKLSMYFEWYVLDHDKDSICLVNPDPAFVPCVLECESSWKVKVANAGFNYDLSPNIGVGFLWQIPLSQRNAYRSSTIMASFNVTF